MVAWFEYDQVVSLGRACQPAYQIRRITGQKHAHAFDWIITTDRGLVDWIVADLDGLFARSRLVKQADGAVCDEHTGTHFLHEFPPGVSFEESYDKNEGRYALLRERWLELMGSSQRVLFVRQHDQETNARAAALTLRDAICAKAPRLRFDLLYLTAHEQDDWGEPGIINRHLPQPTPYVWTGDDYAWSNLLGGATATAPKQAPGIRHVFICGLHRSGTSVLHDILRAHPDVTGFANTGAARDEGQHLQSVIEDDAALGGPGRFCFDERAHLTELHVPEYAVRLNTLRAEWNKLWNPKRLIRVEKSPPNIVRSRFLQAVFSDARFIFIVRHPLAVSRATVKGTQSTVEHAFRHWLAAHHIMLRDARALSRSVCVRYEDISADTVRSLRRVSALMDITSAALDPSAFQDRNGSYLSGAPSLHLNEKDEHLLAHLGYRLEPPFVMRDRLYGW